MSSLHQAIATSDIDPGKRGSAESDPSERDLDDIDPCVSGSSDI